MSELTVGVNSTETLWTVDEVPDSEFTFYTVGTEIVEIQSGAPGGDPGYAVGQTYPATIRVRRGTNGTTAASHLAGAALTAANAFTGEGGGGLDVTDGTTTVTGATVLSVPEVTDEGGGVAAVFQPGFIVSASDPGAVGAGTVWKDISGGVATAAKWWERNAANTGWDASFYQVAHAATDDANVGPVANNSGSGNALAGSDANATGTGDAIVQGTASSNLGSGDAYLAFRARAGAGNYADAYFDATIGGVTAGLSANVDGGVGYLGFNGTTPIAKPIVPLTAPDAQDVIDALVALGLIAQSD